jgi:hypothetical protein
MKECQYPAGLVRNNASHYLPMAEQHQAVVQQQSARGQWQGVDGLLWRLVQLAPGSGTALECCCA